VPGGAPTPAVFNTGQIMLGLIAWYQEQVRRFVLDSLKRSAEWLVSVQETDGSWEKFTYGGVKPTNYTRVAWPLAVVGQVCSEPKYFEAADKFIKWFSIKSGGRDGLGG